MNLGWGSKERPISRRTLPLAPLLKFRAVLNSLVTDMCVLVRVVAKGLSYQKGPLQLMVRVVESFRSYCRKVPFSILSVCQLWQDDSTEAVPPQQKHKETHLRWCAARLFLHCSSQSLKCIWFQKHSTGHFDTFLCESAAKKKPG